MPLWFFVSTIGAFVISVIGVVFLLKKVFKNFDLGDEANSDVVAVQEGGELND